jgi:hypothetical protein
MSVEAMTSGSAMAAAVNGSVAQAHGKVQMAAAIEGQKMSMNMEEMALSLINQTFSRMSEVGTFDLMA